MKEHETLTPEILMNKFAAFVWLGLGIVCLCGAIFCGAWWHLFTAAICAVMYLGFKSEEKRDDGR